MNSKIAFIGLGHMGTPITTRLIRAGNDVTVWDRTREQTAPLVALGAAAAPSAAEAAAGAKRANVEEGRTQRTSRSR
jgi:3-hydroxyisobutyrate dehydrogenase-like beta-hydroxyacid dehydrogenase